MSNQFRHHGTFAAVLGVALLVLGCASSNVNPTAPRTNTGYVDFYAEAGDTLDWDIQRFDASANGFKPVFSSLKPIEGPVLRLAFAPGLHRLRVTVLNRVIAEPVVVEVDVRAGQITPVQVTLSEAGVTSVQSKGTSRGGTAYGRYGRRTKISSDESTLYRVTVAPQPLRTYQLKEQMPYAQQPTK